MGMVAIMVGSVNGESQSAIAIKDCGSESEISKSFADSIGQKLVENVSAAFETIATQQSTTSTISSKPEIASPHLDARHPVLANARQQIVKDNTSAQISDSTILYAGEAGGSRTVSPSTNDLDKYLSRAGRNIATTIYNGVPTVEPQIQLTPNPSSVQPSPPSGLHNTVEPPNEKDPTSVRGVDAVPAAAEIESSVTKDVGRRKGFATKVTIAKGISPIGLPALEAASCVSADAQAMLPSCLVVMAIDMRRRQSQVTKTSVLLSNPSSITSTTTKHIGITTPTGENKSDPGMNTVKVLPAGFKGSTPLAGKLNILLKNGVRTDKSAIPSANGMNDINSKPQGITSPAVLDLVAIGANEMTLNLASGVGMSPASPGAVSAKVQSNDSGTQMTMTHPGTGEPPGLLPAMASTTGVAHRTLISTPTALEVAVPSGSQGWVKIRAEMAGGAINASLTTPSLSGLEALHQELPSLTAYLQQERIAVNVVAVHASAVRTSWNGQPGTVNGGMCGQRQQDGQMDNKRQIMGARGNSRRRNIVTINDPVLYTTNGNWLSVRA